MKGVLRLVHLGNFNMKDSLKWTIIHVIIIISAIFGQAVVAVFKEDMED